MSSLRLEPHPAQLPQRLTRGLPSGWCSRASQAPALLEALSPEDGAQGMRLPLGVQPGHRGQCSGKTVG